MKIERLVLVILLILLLGLPVSAAEKPRAKRPTILLVTIDTLRADRLSCYGYFRGTTPVIDRLSREGVLFQEAVASVPLTTPSHASIFTGLHPRSHAVLGNSWRLGDSCKTLAEHFRGAGYKTAAFVSAVVLDPRCGLDRGFDHYAALQRPSPDDTLHKRMGGKPDEIDREERNRRRMAGRQRRGGETVDLALAWMEAQSGGGEPLFVWVHLYDPHQPYDPPEPFRQLYGPERGGRNLSTVLRPGFDEWRFDQEEEMVRREQARARAQELEQRRERMPMLASGTLSDPERERIDELYDGEIAVSDFQLGRLLAWMKGRGLYHDALVAVMGDHGETLGEHLGGYYGHHHVLYDSSLRIPMILRLPQGGTGDLRPHTATTIDVTPTLLRAAGLVSPAGLDGRDLLSGPPDRPLYCETYLGITSSRRSRPEEAPGQRPTEAGPRRPGIHLHAVRDGRWKLVLADSGQAAPILFDLQSDPGEKRDVADQHQKLVKALSGHWQRWCEAHALPQRDRGRRPEPGVDQEMQDKLRQLGYLE